MIQPKVHIVLVWQRPGNPQPLVATWLPRGDISDVAKAQTYAVQDMSDGADAAVYTFPIGTKDIINTARAFYLAIRS